MIESRLQQNLQQIQFQIAEACRRSSRDPGDIRLVAVTKYAQWEWVTALAGLHSVFGENRPQQLAERQQLLPDVQWHLIGQLQRNKVRLALQHAACIHSVDSLKLLERIALIAEELNIRPPVLLEVNISGEESKSGFSAAELRSCWDQIIDVARHMQISGMMTMAPASDDPQAARPYFTALRELRDVLQQRSPAEICLNELSMGMSGDFEIAVEEGATLVRIGSALFEGLD
ncbi:MAG: YggS family pyridoxal phosphate-dependent enzyme [Planctomycetaceae bacterium]|nr:YggS family pyridoxal phosphate-dependent enzyme [Planctomycetaceae bacterium]